MYLTKKPVVTCPFRYVSSKKKSPWAAGYHPGIDFKAFLLTPIYAPAKSKIIHVGRGGWGGAYGIHVIGESVGTDGKTYWWIAAHLSMASVKVGATIAGGTRIGLSGNTGNTFGPHLHFEVRRAPFRYEDHVNPAVILNVKAESAPKPKPKVARHFEHRHLNTWGDDGAEGTRTFFKRIDSMFNALVAGRPEVITLNEVQADDIASWAKRFKAEGYDVVLAEAGNLVAVPTGTEVRKAQTKYLPASIQGEGRREALGMVRAKINGHWEHIFVSHLDYRDGAKFDEIRVRQARWIADQALRWSITFALKNWMTHTTIGIDENSGSWVRDKAFLPAGFKVAVKSGIDAIYGNRPTMSARTITTASDHPIICAVYSNKA